MKALLSFAVVMFALCPCVHADYYRAAGGGVYELYVDDCTPTAMRRALDRAVASRHAVITSVKCAATPRRDVFPIVFIEMETIPAEYLCPCALVAVTSCGC